jgi:putative chitinase
LKVFISNKLIQLEKDIMLLKLGSEGEDVKKLQIKLGVDPIGKFGPKTEAAVKDWQSKNGLTDDGIVGDKTWGLIMGLTEQVSSPTVITEPAPVKSVGGLKLEGLRGHIPDAVIAQIPDTAAKFEINTPLRLAHFLAQCGHESGGFRLTKENLNYSAKGLNGTFKKYFPTLDSAIPYERKPEKIANKVYGNRMGNGPESSGEGAKFCGRGYIQLTGKENYTAFGKSINEDILSNPDKVASNYALLSAAWFFSKNGLHKMADGGATDAVVTSITKRVNGGTIGLADRIKHFKEYYSLLK